MSLPNPTLALYAKPDGIQMRITAKTTDRENALNLIRGREAELRLLLQDYIWGADKDTIEDIISKLLIAKGLSVSVAESVTGGLLSSSFSNLPGSQRFFRGGITVLNDSIRSRFDSSLPAAVEADVNSAARLAVVARERFDSDIGIGIDGCLPTGPDMTAGKAFIAINIDHGEHNITQTYPSGTYQLVRRSVMHAFFCLRKVLLELD
jgi:nicotinamide-nucleotide amidase